MSYADTLEKLGLTDADIEELAAQYESGEWPEGKTVVRGRPRIYAEELVSVTIKVPRSDLDRLDAAAKSSGKTRSSLIRELINTAAL